MQDETNLWENLELLVETYDGMSGISERWTVRLSSDLDLLIYKETNNTWLNQRTVRYREGDHKLETPSDLPDYLLKNLKANFNSLLYIKSDSRVRYSGSELLLKKLTSYLDVHDYYSSKLKIGKRKYKFFEGLLTDTFFAKPSIAKAIKENVCVLEIQDQEVKISLIRHKEESFILKIEKNGQAAFERLFGNAGVVSQMVSEIIDNMESDSEIRKFTKKYILDEFEKNDFLRSTPAELIIEEEPFGKIIYNFSSNLFSQEKNIWRSKHLAAINHVQELENQIKHIKGVGSDINFALKKINKGEDWDINWTESQNSEFPLLNPRGYLIHNFLLDNAIRLSGFRLEIKVKDLAAREQFQPWVSALSACYEIKII